MVVVRVKETFKLKDRERKKKFRERLRLNPVEYDKFLERDRVRKSLLVTGSRGKSGCKTNKSLISSHFNSISKTPVIYNQGCNSSNLSVYDTVCPSLPINRYERCGNNFLYLNEILKLAYDELKSIV